MRRTRKSSTRKRDERGGAKAPTLTEQVEQKLNERPLYTTWCEQYGPDGEIVMAEEWRPCVYRTMDFYIVSGHGYAEPKTDWRERGVVPPKGVHPWVEDESGYRGKAVERESVEPASAKAAAGERGA